MRASQWFRQCGILVNSNIFEEQAGEYLRYNGFFLIRGFVIHFEDAQPEEIDFVSIRLPESVEQTMYANGSFSNFVFKDDGDKLNLSEIPEIILLVAEVTESDKDPKIKKRIGKLRDPIRISYALQRFGVIEREYINELVRGKAIKYLDDVKACLMRILFVLNDEIAIKYRKENSDIIFISQSDVCSFIENRSKIDIKKRGRTLLPRWLHFFVDKILQH